MDVAETASSDVSRDVYVSTLRHTTCRNYVIPVILCAFIMTISASSAATFEPHPTHASLSMGAS